MPRHGEGHSRSNTIRQPSRRQFLQVATATGAFTGLAGCVEELDGGEDDDTGLEDETVSIGVLSPMSGPFSALGPGQRAAAHVAADHINDSDDFDFDVEIETEDTETDPSDATRRADRLVEEGTDFLAGGINSSVALALADLAGSEEVVYTTGGAGMALTESECNAYTFRNEMNAALQSSAVASWIIDQDPDSIWIHTADYEYGQSSIEQLEAQLDGTGIEIAGQTSPAQGTDSFGPFISEIRDAEPDILAVPLTGGDLINFLTQAQDRELKEDMDIIGTANFSRVVRGGAGPAAVDGTFSAALYDAGLEVSDNQEFVDAYQDAEGEPPDHFARIGFDAVRTTAMGIQEAGSTDPVEVAETMSGMDIQTVVEEDTYYRECDHQAPMPIRIAEVVAVDDERSELDILDTIPADETTPECTGVCDK